VYAHILSPTVAYTNTRPWQILLKNQAITLSPMLPTTSCYALYWLLLWAPGSINRLLCWEFINLQGALLTDFKITLLTCSVTVLDAGQVVNKVASSGSGVS